MGSSTNNHGLYGESENLRGVKGVSPVGGVYGESTQGWGVEGRSDNSDGVVGYTNSSSKSGVWGRSTPGVGVTGRSENNDGVVGITASTQPGNAGVRARNEGGGPAVYCEGDLYVTGAVRGNLGPNQNGASFPRPAWNSGWVPLPHIPGHPFTLTHGVGGNVDDYVIDIQFRDDNWYGIHQINYGTGKDKDGRWAGAEYSNLTNQSIDIYRAEDDPWCDEVRVRIWICQ
jgi:hypothetical protein